MNNGADTMTSADDRESLLRLVVEAAPYAVLVVDAQGCIALVNVQTERLFGYPREELAGKPVEILLPPEQGMRHSLLRGGCFADLKARAMGSGQELFGLTRQGLRVPVEIGLNPIETGQGRFVLASIVDVSERKRAEESVRNSEARFRLMVSGVKDYAMLMLDAQGCVASWNEGAQRLKGYSEQEIVGRHFSVFYPGEAVEARKPEAELHQAIAQGRFEDEGWRVRKDGSRFWASVIITPMLDEHGVLTGFSKVTRDMTERRRSEERFRLAVESAPNAMIMVNADGVIALVNRQAETLFGYAREELLGGRLEMLVPASRRQAHPDLRAGYFAHPDARPMGAGRDLHGVRKDGREVLVEIGLNPIQTGEGSFVLASIIDITGRKRAEQALRTLNQSLAAQVEETQRALRQLEETQNQLVQAEKLASLGGLVAGVAHEINTPVGVSITAASHLQGEVHRMALAARENSLTKTQFASGLQSIEEASDLVLRNLNRAAELVQSFKRVAVDQSSEERRRVNLKAYLQEVLISLNPILKAAGHKVALDCPEDLEIVTAPGALSQILTNLVANSATHAFSPGRPGHILIRVARQGEGLELRFSDDGRGIPPDHLARIFDPFFTTRRGQGGTGLGLHIVFNLVHQTLGGTIRAESTPGRGTSFIILF